MSDETSVVEPPKKKRRKAVRLDAKTVQWLRARGWCAGIVERRHGPFSFDFMGFSDINGIKKRRPPIGVQVCRGAGGARAAHREKLLTGDGAPGVRDWLLQDGAVFLICWDLRRDFQGAGKKSTGRELWRVSDIERIQFVPGEESAPVGRLEAVECPACTWGEIL